MIEPDGGAVLLDGSDVRDVRPEELRRRIGYAIQGVGLFPHWTVHQNIGVVPWLLKWDQPRIEARVRDLLELVGLDPALYDGKYPDELSGGEAQRVGVARALAADPPILLMDEPFGAVDPLTRDRLQTEFVDIQRRLRKTVVFVTHDMDEAVRLGDRIAIMRDGRLLQYDTPERVLAYPADELRRGLRRPGARAEAALARAGDRGARSGRTRPRAATATVRADATLREALAKILEYGTRRRVRHRRERGAASVRSASRSIVDRFRRPLT